MKKKIIALLMVVLIFGLTACGAVGTNSGNTKVDLSKVKDSTYTITQGGTYVLSGTYEGQIVVEASDTENVELIFNGVDITNTESAAVYVKTAKNVSVVLEEGTENNITCSGSFEQTDDNKVDAAIFSKTDLIFDGSGTLTINSSAHGIVGKDDLVIKSGNIDITSTKKAISGKDSVTVTGGNLTIAAGTDGINTDGTLDISAGKIDITKSNEGLEGKDINISGGEINIVSSDDGINATDSSTTNQDDMAVQDASLNISGGKITINAQGDGIDSNGNITVTGGETYVSGPENAGNGGLDYNGTATITGGTFVVASAQGMDMNFGSDSTQGSILVTVSNQEAGTKVTLKDANGKVLVSYTPDKAYSSVLISTAGMVKGETYTIIAGTETKEITLDELISGSGSTMGGPGGFGGTPPTGTPPTGTPPTGTPPGPPQAGFTQN